MDSGIENLATTTFHGRRFTRKQLMLVQQTTDQFPNLSRRELAHTVCELLSWQTPNGQDKIQACLGMLESLENQDILKLPKKDLSKQRGPQKKITLTEQTKEQPPIDQALNELTPISLQVASDKEEIKQWNEYVDRYHYLGYKRPIGQHIRYFILDNQQRKLGCLLFSYASKRLPCRDEWIGWENKSHKKHLHLVINNNRFLIFPWVQVKCLASKALSLASRQLESDWDKLYGYKPVLLETFVDHTQYNATCYRAANWLYLGDTNGRTSTKEATATPPKGVYIYPLNKDAKNVLNNGPNTHKTRPRHAPDAVSRQLTPEDPFIHLWQKIIGTITNACNEFDQKWQKRQRVLNTLLITLFIFRLVFSQNKQGYATTIAELWDQCRVMNIPLPQPNPVAPSAFSNARKKLHENIFKVLHAEILQHYEKPLEDDHWLEHRIYAVDGSKINLPRQLIDFGYTTPSDNAHYPQGLLSCLYQLKTKIPVDFELSKNNDERKLALKHLQALRENDVVVYDRGYFSYAMLYEHRIMGAHPIFRIKNKANKSIDDFIASKETDKIITIAPNQDNISRLIEKYPNSSFKPISMRVVKYSVSGTTYILGTTLVDSSKYTIEALSNVYHARWGVEELYKISKQLVKVEEFHGQSERGVKQELYAHFVLVTLTRIFSNHSEDGFNKDANLKNETLVRANFKNSLATVSRNIESLLLQQVKLLTDTVNYIVKAISFSRQKVRPNRSYDRHSRKPIGKWKPPKKAKATAGVAVPST